MKIFSFLVFAFFSICVNGQTRGYAGYIRIASKTMHDARNVLPQIVPGISGFSSNFYGVGGELEYKINRTVFDAELMILSQGPVNSGERFAEPFTGHVIVKAGYDVFNTNNVFIYPNAGVGLGGILVNTYQKTEGVKTGMHTIYLVQPVFDIGLNGDVIIYRFRNEMPTGVLPVGLRAGYRFAFSSDTWRRANGPGVSSADFSTRGWYLSIALGMGYITSNHK